jgi:ribosome-associated protein
LTSKEKALALAEAARDHKALEIRVLDLRGIASFTDFFVLTTATSDRHARTLADAIGEKADELGSAPIGVEGLETSRWILIDVGDVILHVFLEEVREYYALERLWGDAEPVEVPQAAAALR